jgi:uncharacterized damage-inducible protein DinB
MNVKDLKSNEYFEFYATYISKVGDTDLIEGLIKNKKSVVAFLNSIDSKNYDYKYAEGKWTIKELIQHIIDTERIFTNRALRIARNDKANLPGFDQDEFNPYSGANNRSKEDLISDYTASRANTISLFQSFSDEMLLSVGNASDHELSARATGFIIIGHENHHVEILKERYL